MPTKNTVIFKSLYGNLLRKLGENSESIKWFLNSLHDGGELAIDEVCLHERERVSG